MAVEMQFQPKLVGYIYVYAGQRARLIKARTQGELLKRYLVEGHGLGAERMMWKDGGHREQAMVELWVWPPKLGEPLATPEPEVKEVEIIEDCRSEKQVRGKPKKSSAVPNKGINRPRAQLLFYLR